MAAAITPLLSAAVECRNIGAHNAALDYTKRGMKALGETESGVLTGLEHAVCKLQGLHVLCEITVDQTSRKTEDWIDRIAEVLDLIKSMSKPTTPDCVMEQVRFDLTVKLAQQVVRARVRVRVRVT